MTLKKSLALIAASAGIGLSFSVIAAFAWDGPTQTAPNGNVAAPVNVGGVFQNKTGGAWFDGGIGIDVGSRYCIGASCIDAWPGLTLAAATTTYASVLNVVGNATSTFANGINLTNGCLAINGVCVGGSGGSVLGGSGTTNRVPKFTAATTLGNSQIFDNGTNVGIGNTAPTQKLDVTGYVKGTGMCNGASCITAWPSGGGSAPASHCSSSYRYAWYWEVTCVTLATGKICQSQDGDGDGVPSSYDNWICATLSGWN